MVQYIVDHIPRNTPYSRRPGIAMQPEYITIHSTGNEKSTARNERDWLTNPNNTRQASWHICVDEKEAVEAIPLDEVAYHAGTKAGNNSSIGIEICESGDREKTLANAAKLVARMLHERNWGVERLRRHFDWSGKICPRIFYDGGKWTGWEQFKQAVQKELDALKGGVVLTDKNTPSPWAKEAWDWAKKEGITDGTRPKDTPTREEIITMLYRYHKRWPKNEVLEGNRIASDSAQHRF